MNIAEAIKLAEQGKSGLTPEVIKNLKGMSSPHIWHLLNNLVQGPYLEVGVWKGSTLTAALTGKDIKATAIDDFSQFGGPRAEFLDNVRGLGPFRFIDGNCFDPAVLFDVDPGIEYYFYDGGHSLMNQYSALVVYIEKMAPEFTYLVDDWNVPDVAEGTKSAIRDLNLTIVESYEMFTPKNGCKDSWWNGFAVFKLRK